MSPSLLVVGSFNQDLAFEVRAFPAPGETIVGDFRTSPGGKGFNQAVAAARTGVRTLFVGAVGPDAFGRAAPKIAATAGVRARFIPKPKHPTGVAVITVNAAGENQIILSPGANFALRPRDIPTDALAAATITVCQGETPYPTIAHVLRTARRQQATTIFNPAPMRPDFDLHLLKPTEILIVNESEFAALLALSPATKKSPPAARALATLSPATWQTLCRSLGVPVVIVTRGADGCFVSQADGHVHIHAHDVEVVDTTGAGDAFVGGFAAGLAKFKHDILEAAHYANAVAALCTLQPGAAPAMPIAREIARFRRLHDHR